jgi:pimeloyl-ACP methyl ester carboxylesterase
VNTALVPLGSTLFPGLGVETGILVHAGDALAHALYVGFGWIALYLILIDLRHDRAAPHVLAAVRSALAQYSAKTVVVVGHSLGGTIAVLDAVYLPLHLPAGTAVKAYTYGQPMVCISLPSMHSR